MRALVVALALLVPSLASPARAFEDTDTELAKRHYATGTRFYDSGEYDKALAEFEAAYRAKPLPGFQFNIAKCNDRLEHISEAVRAYQAYLDASPAAKDRDEVSERIAVLKRRADEIARLRPHATERPTDVTGPTPVAEGPSLVSRHKPGFVLAALTVALAIGGGVALGVASGRYGDLQSSCMHNCTDDMIGTVSTPADIGYVMLGLAGASAIASVIAFLVEDRAPESHVALASGGLALVF